MSKISADMVEAGAKAALAKMQEVARINVVSWERQDEDIRGEYRQMIRAALTAALECRGLEEPPVTGLEVPEGWMLVPKVATGVMLGAMYEVTPALHIHHAHSLNDEMALVSPAWEAALAKARVCPGCGGDTDIDGIEYCDCKGTGRRDPVKVTK